MVHSNGTVDVFDTYHATSADAHPPATAAEPATTDRLVVLHVNNDRYTLHGDQLHSLYQLIAEADTSEDAWEATIEFAHQHQTDPSP